MKKAMYDFDAFRFIMGMTFAMVAGATLGLLVLLLNMA